MKQMQYTTSNKLSILQSSELSTHTIMIAVIFYFNPNKIFFLLIKVSWPDSKIIWGPSFSAGIIFSVRTHLIEFCGS